MFASNVGKFSSLRVIVMRSFMAFTAVFFALQFLTLFCLLTFCSSEGSSGSYLKSSKNDRHFAAFVIFWEASISAYFLTMFIMLSSLLLPSDPQGSSRISISMGSLLLAASLAAELPGFLRSASSALSFLCFSKQFFRSFSSFSFLTFSLSL